MRKPILITSIAAIAFCFVMAIALLNRTRHRNVQAGAADVPRQVSDPRQAERRFVQRDDPRPSPALSNTGEPQDGGATLTPEEHEAMRELARRSRNGEYILGSDNPANLRARRESLKNRMENSLPGMMAARHDVLSGLNVAPETIARLTNHAARIAEASWAVVPLLNELSAAKVMYDAKMRELLTPEQYEKFKEFETRQALEKEWKKFEMDGMDRLSLHDLRAITKSLEELGIRERTSSASLPYDPEPTSGNLITATDRDVHEILRNKISRLDAAASDIAAIAERNQLSGDARQALAAMVANKSRALRERLSNTPTDEENGARFRAMIEAHRGRPLPK